jgi:RND family efflux transporter MFP subunit
MKRLWTFLPILILVAAALGTVALVKSRPKPATRQPEEILPVVRVHTIALSDVVLTVESQGTVGPRTQSVLVPQVAGRVIEASPSFVAGGFFEEGDLLLQIDPHDYHQALVTAKSHEAQARLRVATVHAEAELAREEWDELGEGEAGPLTLFEPQLAEADAALDAALAGVQQAETNLARTEVRAPYAGRVQSKQVDRGQVVAPGTPLAMIYAVDFAEVRLPLPDDQLAFVELPLSYRGESGSRKGPPVVLRAEFAGRTHEWTGRVVRTEGTIDPVSRMVHAVAQIEDPYGRSEPGRPPLAVGMYVEAEIRGKSLTGVAEIPRSAMRQDGTVLVIDSEDRVRIREVRVTRTMKDSLIVAEGLADGDRLCTSRLSAVIDGMRVAVREADAG